VCTLLRCFVRIRASSLAPRAASCSFLPLPSSSRFCSPSALRSLHRDPYTNCSAQPGLPQLTAIDSNRPRSREATAFDRTSVGSVRQVSSHRHVVPPALGRAGHWLGGPIIGPAAAALSCSASWVPLPRPSALIPSTAAARSVREICAGSGAAHFSLSHHARAQPFFIFSLAFPAEAPSRALLFFI
jgi:hypothetical protein